MIQTIEESRTDQEPEKDVPTGLTVLHTLRSSTQKKVWMLTSVEIQLQMRRPKQFGASLREVLLFTSGNIVTHLAEKTMEPSAKDLSQSPAPEAVAVVFLQTPKSN
jgi:hypothetical protein